MKECVGKSAFNKPHPIHIRQELVFAFMQKYENNENSFANPSLTLFLISKPNK
jgi:hypothetical protein